MRLGAVLLALAAPLAAPAVAADIAGTAPLAARALPPAMLTPAERAAYRAAFAAIRAGDFAAARAMLDTFPAGPLDAVARAELALAGGLPLADGATLAALAAGAPELPQAPALVRLAAARGASVLPLLPAPRDLVRLAAAPKRLPARPARADAAGAALALRLQPLLGTNDAAAAEPLVEEAAARLSPEALTEWRQRVAWSYLLAGADADARRVAGLARAGAGEWAARADWVAGLAAWRSGDRAAAAEAFAALAARARDPEMIAAGLYWAARADAGGARPERAEPRLRSAARMRETFYGMLAAGLLGLPDDAGLAPAFAADDAAAPGNARAAAALVEIGETALADRLLRHQARIGDPARHGALAALAAQLQLPATQVWLAQYGPAGTTTQAAARYPMPAWSPSGGWRVDRALLLAHALQESELRPDAVSHAGARGLMQLMPATARLVARHKLRDGDAAAGAAADDLGRLGDPAVSFEYGQSYLEELAGNPGTQGLLPKVIAAYNAGPNNVAAWSLRPGAGDDPLFFIETMPFAETRTYVTTVLRNYWMYQRETGAATESLVALTQGRWPRFPGATVPQRLALRAGDTIGAQGGAD